MFIDKSLKRLRKEKGWNQKELAAKSNLSVTAISNYERGDREPKEYALKALASALDVPEVVLLLNDAWETNVIDSTADFYPREASENAVFESINRYLVPQADFYVDEILTCDKIDDIFYREVIILTSKALEGDNSLSNTVSFYKDDINYLMSRIKKVYNEWLKEPGHEDQALTLRHMQDALKSDK